MAMYTAQNEQSELYSGIVAECGNELLKENLLVCKKFLDLFKASYDPLYLDIAGKMNFSDAKETMRKCDQLIEFINNISSGNYNIFSNVSMDVIHFYYESIQSIITDMLNSLSERKPPSMSVAWHYNRSVNFINKYFSGDEINDLPESVKNDLKNEVLNIEQLTSIADSIDSLYDVFKNYGFNI